MQYERAGDRPNSGTGNDIRGVVSTQVDSGDSNQACTHVKREAEFRIPVTEDSRHSEGKRRVP